MVDPIPTHCFYKLSLQLEALGQHHAAPVVRDRASGCVAGNHLPASQQTDILWDARGMRHRAVAKTTKLPFNHIGKEKLEKIIKKRIRLVDFFKGHLQAGIQNWKFFSEDPGFCQKLTRRDPKNPRRSERSRKDNFWTKDKPLTENIPSSEFLLAGDP
ncbi:hypothetical protein AVEN_41870-1 [Araneus ventricosus]|uniref:Uncharacterized protein n=1 Tax=Araneus ventricosus TaxID=182803 RepID=A0A4Y2AE38_ARAVE|nr:hypothetical protein AVEN_41870-1 [Araneus ventricosus]